MRRMALFASFSTLLITILALTPATALERAAYSMEILVDGRPLREFHARGTTYVEALRNREYAVRLSNHTGGRVAVALSVDGLNSIDARRTSARDASKWILAPFETITIQGWQTGSATARRFFFTTEDESYGAWLGKTDDLGIVSAAFFRERRPKPTPIAPGEPKPLREGASDSNRRSRPLGKSEAAPQAEAEARGLSDDLAATGIGREIDHRVRRVRFDAERNPAAVVQVRYEYRDALVRLGVIPSYEDPFARRERARGFEDTGFAPDPYRTRD